MRVPASRRRRPAGEHAAGTPRRGARRRRVARARAAAPHADPLPVRHALALGLIQGPTELLPVSSSAHTELLPWLAGWPYAALDGRRRKSFELALHAGAGLALALGMRSELLHDGARLDARRAGSLALALGLPALAGYTLERPIERRLGGPRSIAAGLAAGALALALADRRASPDATRSRTLRDAGPGDGLALGLAQALALIPGVSRNGATLTAARARGFDRRAADALSWHAGLPVMLGASALRGARMLRDGVSREERLALAVGAASAFGSTLASAAVLTRAARTRRSLLPYALYRCLLAGLVLRRTRSGATRTPT
ncbi:MAG TPA: undecaprenyl-diphosphate phosphatase [Solirubrobacteraceae bacterium]|nr:undecaprenyl-diphosphate phosphatase [Solirubrobacteraceae bacterium]